MLVYGKLRALAVARRARRAVARLPRRRPPLRPARARHAARHRRASRPTWRDMYASGELFVTPAARELAIDIVLHPPVPLHARPLRRAGQPDHGRPGCRPALRRQYGFSLGPAARRVALRGGAELRQAPRAADRGSSRAWTASARKFATTIEQHALEHQRLEHRRRRRRVDRVLITRNIPGMREGVLDHRDVDQQRGDVHAGHRGDRGRGDRERVAVDDAPLGQALGARGADEVLAAGPRAASASVMRRTNAASGSATSSHGTHIAFTNWSGSSRTARSRPGRRRTAAG